MRTIPLRVIYGSAGDIRQDSAGSIARHLSRLRTLLRLWRQRRRGRAALASFDDRMLRDIGITRMEAHYEINKPFWRE